jgi:hypothetical protein
LSPSYTVHVYGRHAARGRKGGMRGKRGEKVRRKKRMVGGMGRKDFEGKAKVEINNKIIKELKVIRN